MAGEPYIVLDKHAHTHYNCCVPEELSGTVTYNLQPREASLVPVGELRERWQGAAIPLTTRFKEDLSLGLSGLERDVAWLTHRGARTGNTVLLAAGSGGGSTSMSPEERKQVIRTVCDAAAGRVAFDDRHGSSSLTGVPRAAGSARGIRTRCVLAEPSRSSRTI